MDNRPITALSTLAWAFVAVLIAVMAIAIGDMISLSGERMYVRLVKGLITILLTGLVTSAVAGWCLELILGPIRRFRDSRSAREP